MKNHLMTGAALVLLIVTPALARHATAPSKSAEIEATRALNMQASQAAAPVPAMTPSPENAAATSQQPPSAAPTIKVQTAFVGAATASDTPLSAMTNPPSKIASANVLDSSGAVVGAVQRVEVTPQGQPTKVAVALIGQGDKLLVLDANAVRYDAGKNEITAPAIR
jgi:hypothetical protein